MKQKVFHIISYFTIAITIASVLFISYLALYTPKVITINAPLKVDKQTYHIGDTLTYTLDYCKYKNYETEDYTRFLSDGYLYELPSDLTEVSNLPLGCHKLDLQIPLVVPPSIQINHTYKVKITVQRKVNFLQTQTESYDTEEFNLIK